MRYALVLGVVIVLFLLNFLTRVNQMPQHLDEWEHIVVAKLTMETGFLQGHEPYRSEWIYPPGIYTVLSSLSLLSGLSLITIQKFLPSIFYIILGLMFYILSLKLFKRDEVAIAVMAFSTLILSNITIMGIYYLVPLAMGSFLTLLLLYFLVQDNWLMSLFILLAIAITHASTIVLAFVATFFYLVFSRKWRLIFMGLVGFMLVLGLMKFKNIYLSPSIDLLKYIFFRPAVKPFVIIANNLPWFFLVLLALGIFFIMLKERKASYALVPLFVFMIVDFFMYWKYRGFVFVYRRLIYFIFLFIPFFVGYAVHHIADTPNRLFDSKWLKQFPIFLIIFLLILVPFAWKLNQESHVSEIYIMNDEHPLFTKFGEAFPNEKIITRFMMGWAMPYYDLEEVHLPPGHPVINSCFANKDSQCFADFMQQKDIKYVYAGFDLDGELFKPVAKYKGLIIYKLE